jgi:hypothetical protein
MFKNLLRNKKGVLNVVTGAVIAVWELPYRLSPINNCGSLDHGGGTDSLHGHTVLT